MSLQRPQQAPDDLVLTLDMGGRIRIKDFFKGPSLSIERIVFDDAPAWGPEKLQRLAALAPVGDDDAPPLHDQNGVPTPAAFANGAPLEPAGHALHGLAASGDDAGPAPANADTLQPAADLWLALEAQASWLF